MSDRDERVIGSRGRALCWVALVPGSLLPAGRLLGGDFATEVIGFQPAPGQFINDVQFNDPSRALGAPVGGGLLSPANGKIVSLGGFGGSIVLGFSETVLDDPCNPFGLDAIVFGNAFFADGMLDRRWGEAGMIEISLDLNGNGLADDPWFVVAGPWVTGAAPADQLEMQMWDDDPATATPPAKANLAWYPSPLRYPLIGPAFTTSTFRAPAALEVAIIANPGGDPTDTSEAWWTLADMSPGLLLGDLDADDVVDDPTVAPGAFYTRPDNPFRSGITPGSGGGDAFDIAWAVDPLTGESAHLPGFDYIRITTGTNVVLGFLGESSTEVGAVSDVRADPAFFERSGDGSIDPEDLWEWHAMARVGDVGADLNGDLVVEERDRAMMVRCVRSGEASDMVTR